MSIRFFENRSPGFKSRLETCLSNICFLKFRLTLPSASDALQMAQCIFNYYYCYYYLLLLQIIMACRENFGFRLPSELIASLTKKLESSQYIAF